jgi:hypothetical protein
MSRSSSPSSKSTERALSRELQRPNLDEYVSRDLSRSGATCLPLLVSIPGREIPADPTDDDASPLALELAVTLYGAKEISRQYLELLFNVGSRTYGLGG